MYLVFILFLAIIAIILHHLNKTYFLLAGCKRVKTINGDKLENSILILPQKTIFGHNFDLISIKSPDELFDILKEWSSTLKSSFLTYYVRTPILNITDPEYAELILSDQGLINKGLLYKILIPFLGTGLLTSTSKKWFNRRKLLTPAFHFTILQRFLETFKDETKKFLHVLQEHAESNTEFCLNDVIPKFTLNNICETAMGVNIDDIGKTEEYMKNIHVVEAGMFNQFCNPIFLLSEKIFKMTKTYKMICHASKKIHNFSSGVIQLRRKLYKQNQNKEINYEDNSEESIYFKKKRSAMLDTLLEAEENQLIDHQGICEEVNTFMFEGYDTTSSGLLFVLLMLAIDQDIQYKCFTEINETGGDLSSLSIRDYQKFKYLECVIKETMRLFPPVPFISRLCEKETILGNLILPKGSNLNLIIYGIHRNEKYYPDPNKFDPDRFLPENSLSRHPYAFIPFSAGSRNCIGQKFAMLEIKVLLVNVIKNYKLMTNCNYEDIVVSTGLVLTSKNPIYLTVQNR